ncbi:hypothetical protein BaRGS_00000909, partial [Batillaria attramentaria]
KIMQGGNEEQHCLLLEDTSASSGTATRQDHAQDVKGKSGPRLNLRDKLTLVATFLGNESSISYEQLYLVPVLQTLGMPLRLSSLTGLVSGVLGVVILPILGWLSDRGSNPNRRKRNGVLASTSIMLLGISVVIVASVLHLQKVPVTAGFAMLGFVVYEFGIDNANSFSRSWILACSSRCEHTSLLVLGLVMAAVGGISTAALARVDFLSLLNLAYTD